MYQAYPQNKKLPLEAAIDPLCGAFLALSRDSDCYFILVLHSNYLSYWPIPYPNSVFVFVLILFDFSVAWGHSSCLEKLPHLGSHTPIPLERVAILPVSVSSPHTAAFAYSHRAVSTTSIKVFSGPKPLVSSPSSFYLTSPSLKHDLFFSS